jgi:carboxypeptidase family protein
MRKQVFVLLLIVAAACSGPPTASSPIYSLSGRIIDSATTAGINGASITVADGPDRNKYATTDAAGNYSLNGLSASVFTVIA